MHILKEEWSDYGLMNDLNEDKTVACLAEIVALGVGMHPDAAEQIREAGMSHDVGKIKLPAGIINKPGSLSEREFEIMKTHTVLGAEMLRDMPGKTGEMARVTARYHHEWYDGGGYWGKRLCDLPRYVAVVAIADVFTALVSERPYKAAWPPDDALSYIKGQAGTQFSPWLVEAFVALIETDSRVLALFHSGGDEVAGGN